MKIRSIWLGMLMGLCVENTEAAEKRQEEGWHIQIFTHLSLFWEQALDQKLDFRSTNSLEEGVESLTKKRDQLDREIRDRKINPWIPLKDIPCEVLCHFAAQQEETRKKINERDSLTLQIFQKKQESRCN